MPYDSFLGYSSITSRRTMLWRQLAAEYLGTLFIVLLGCGSTVSGWKNGDSPPVFRIAFAFGFCVAVVVEVTSHISGGHVNPAVTLAMLITRRITLIPGLLFILVQLMGATSGAGLLKLFTPVEFNSTLGLNVIDNRMSVGQGLAVELLITFILILVILSVTDEDRDERKGTISAPIGIAVAVGHLFAIPYTGCGMNPARVFGSAAVLSEWKDHWVYWVGECAGAVLATCFYIVLFSADELHITDRLTKICCYPPGYKSLQRTPQEPSVPPTVTVCLSTEVSTPYEEKGAEGKYSPSTAKEETSSPSVEVTPTILE